MVDSWLIAISCELSRDNLLTLIQFQDGAAAPSYVCWIKLDHETKQQTCQELCYSCQGVDALKMWFQADKRSVHVQQPRLIHIKVTMSSLLANIGELRAENVNIYRAVDRV